MATRDKKRISQDSEIARFYLDLIILYSNIGVGNQTPDGTMVTKKLIVNCKERHFEHAIRAHKREVEFG